MKRKALDSARGGESASHTEERQEPKRTRLENVRGLVEASKRRVEDADKRGVPKARREARMDLEWAELDLAEAKLEEGIADAERTATEARKELTDATPEDDKIYWKEEMQSATDRADKLTGELDALRANREQKLVALKNKLLQLFPQVTELTLPQFSENDRVHEAAHYLLEFAPPPDFEDVVARVMEQIEVSPRPEARWIRFVELLGPMGTGKTRMGEEVARQIRTVREQRGQAKTLICYVRISVFKSYVVAADPLNTLAQALVFSQKPAFEQLPDVTFDDLTKHLNPTRTASSGRTEVIVLLDEIQADRPLVDRLLVACENSMITENLGLVVVPIMSGISSPTFKTLPSGASTIQYMMKPIALEKALPVFCAAIKCEESVLESTPNLFLLFKMCQGHPYLLCMLTRVITRTLEDDEKNPLPNIDVHQAHRLLGQVMLGVDDAYGPQRYHAVFGVQEAYGSETITDRVTLEILRAIALDAYTERDVSAEMNARVAMPVDGYDENKFPTYQACIDNGLFAIIGGKVILPLLVLLSIDNTVHVLPIESLRSPFDANWATWETAALGSIYLRLMSARRRRKERMHLTDLRPDAVWHGCKDIEIEVPSSKDLDFVFLGQHLDQPVIQKGSDGVGKEFVVKPGLVAVTKANEAGWDGFVLLRGWNVETSMEVLVLMGCQVQSRESNIINGVPSTTVLGNAAIRTIMNTQLKPNFKSVIQRHLPEDEVVAAPVLCVFDVFSNRYDPQNATLDGVALPPLYCVTRGDETIVNRVLGTPLGATLDKKQIS